MSLLVTGTLFLHNVLFSSPVLSIIFCCRPEALRCAAERVKRTSVPSFSGYFTPGCFRLIYLLTSQRSTPQQSLIGRKRKSYTLFTDRAANILHELISCICVLPAAVAIVQFYKALNFDILIRLAV